MHWADGEVLPCAATAGAGSRLIVVEEQTRASADGGATWEARASPSLCPDGPLCGKSLVGVAMTDSGARVVAATHDGAVAYSTDGGASWKAASPAPGVYLTSVAGTGTRFVAAGAGSVAYSTDSGATWTFSNGGSFFYSWVNVVGVVWTGARFVTVGHNGDVIYSSTGQTWSKATVGGFPSGFSPWLSSVAGQGQVLVAVGRRCAIRSSDGGLTWTTLGDPIIATAYWKSVTWTGAQFVAVTDAGKIVASPDGATWSHVARAPTTETLSSAAGNGATVVAVGDNGAIVRSGDGGISWSAADAAPWPLGATYDTYGAGESSPPPLGSVAVSGSTFLAGAGVPVRSVDGGKTWAEPTGGTIGYYRKMAMAGSLAFAVKDGSLLRSTDGGVSWAPASTDPVSFSLSSVAVSGSRVVAVGKTGGVVYSSDGGETWKTSGQAVTRTAISDVAWIGDRLVAVTDEWTVLRSSDGGERWELVLPLTAAQSSVANDYGKVACSPTRCLVLLSGHLLESTDAGATWVEGAFPEGYWPDDAIGIAWTGTRFLAVGGQGLVLTAEP